MKNILLITSSPRGEMSHSTKVATDLAQQLGGVLITRELWRNPVEPIGPGFVHALFTPADARSTDQKRALALSDELVAEVLAADLIVIGAGMINFGMPASLKTWVDLITRTGITFRYGEEGPVGLISGKKVILVLASGGVYSSGPVAFMDHLEPALRGNLGFLGMTDVETLRIEGVSMGEEAISRALELADVKAKQLVGSYR